MGDLFRTNDAALAYLRENIRCAETGPAALDTSVLQTRLFPLPRGLAEGEHKFVGDRGLSIEFTLKSGEFYFNDCYLTFAKHPHPLVHGDLHPIYCIYNLEIRTENFSLRQNDLGDPVQIVWMPRMVAKDPEQSPAFAFIDRRRIYLFGEDGYLSRPADLLGLMHEIGHLQTRSPEDLNKELRTIPPRALLQSISVNTTKEDAYELQRELDANSWAKAQVAPLFHDLQIPADQLDAAVLANLKTYRDMYARRYFSDKRQEQEE